MKTIYEQYAEIRKQKEILDLMEENLKKGILEEMQKNKAVKEEFDYGSFTVASRKTYTYSPTINTLKEEIKLKEIEEVEKGIAQVKVTSYVTYKAK